MKRGRVYLISFIVTIFLLIVLYFDKNISFLLNYIQISGLNEFLHGILLIGSEIVMIGFLTVLFLWKNKRKFILPLWFTIGVSGAIGFFMKIIFERLRPFQQSLVPTFPFISNASYLTWNFSFPSFHALLIFSVLPLISQEFPKLKRYWILIGSLILFSRFYFGIHFLSDIIFGSLLGYLVGKFVLKTENETSFLRNIYRKVIRKK